MSKILYIAWKEGKIQSRYRFVWFNRSLTPFFMLAPYVLIARSLSSSLESWVLLGSLIWYWLNQYFFGVGDAFSEEREEGTMANIALSPLSLLGFLIGKGLWLMVDCLYITAITIVFFALLGVSQDAWWLMLLLYLLCGVFMFAFSIFFAGLVLIFRRLASINFIIQQGLGLLSGQTAKIEAYPRSIQLIAYTIPLTYAIRAGRALVDGNLYLVSSSFVGLISTTMLYLLIGLVAIHWAEKRLRIEGGWEVW